MESKQQNLVQPVILSKLQKSHWGITLAEFEQTGIPRQFILKALHYLQTQKKIEYFNGRYFRGDR